MLVCQNFVYTDALLPEGSAGLPLVSKLLGSLVRGQPVPAGAPGAAGLAAHNKPVLALVCDPRSWYLTLWRHGCEGMGPLFHRMGDEDTWQELRKRAGSVPTALAAGGAASAMAAELPAEWGADRALDTWYANPHDVSAFREWLRAVMAVRALRGLVSPDYARSPLSRSCGFMTFRYHQLFIHNPNELGMPATDARSLQALDRSKGLVVQAVRMEQFAADLPPALEALGVVLDEQQRASIEAVQANLPTLRREWHRFFGLDELALIDQRERFICARLRFSVEPARTRIRSEEAGQVGPKSTQGQEGAGPARRPAAAKKAAARRATAAASSAAPAQPDAAEIARQERIANIRRLQQERLAQRRASGKASPPRPPASKALDDDGLTLLQDFDED